MAFIELDPAPELGPLEHVCDHCHLIHHTPTGDAFCEEAS